MIPVTSIPPTLAGIMSSVLLIYPISTKPVHPIVQIIVCASLMFVGLVLFGSYFTESFQLSPWWLLALGALSVLSVIVPVVGSIVGLGTTAGLVSYSAICSYVTPLTTHVVVAIATLAGMSVLFVYRPMFLHWQMVVPPVVGGYLAPTAVSGYECSETIQLCIWVVLAIASVGLHIRKRITTSWLEKKKEAVFSESNESQITRLMKSAKPAMTVDEFDVLKQKLLTAVNGDTEQVDRVVYGGGLY